MTKGDDQAIPRPRGAESVVELFEGRSGMMRTNDRDAANEIDEAMRLWPRRRRPRVEDEDRGIVRLRGGGRIEGTVARRDRKAIVVQTSQGTVVVIATAEDR